MKKRCCSAGELRTRDSFANAVYWFCPRNRVKADISLHAQGRQMPPGDIALWPMQSADPQGTSGGLLQRRAGCGGRDLRQLTDIPRPRISRTSNHRRGSMRNTDTHCPTAWAEKVRRRARGGRTKI